MPLLGTRCHNKQEQEQRSQSWPIETMATIALENDLEEKQHETLLAKALDIPSLNHGPGRETPLKHHESSGNSSGTSLGLAEPFLGMPRHSDFTIPTSNISDLEDNGPPDSLFMTCNNNNSRRSVFGAGVKEKYGAPFQRVESTETLEVDNQTSFPPLIPQQGLTGRNVSDLTPPSSPQPRHSNDMISPLTPYQNGGNENTKAGSTSTSRYIRAHETIHAQSLLLGFAFMAIWSPQNGMAPNLTEIANDFGFSAEERDLYLGSIVALATGVLSLPISAGIGILADVYNRKYLYCTTVAMGGLFSWATGASRSYRWLFWARLLNGGCMSGSVPVAFSLLGDLFHTHERNAASSGLTAMMGMGIVAGQVYAGMVGSTLGWPHAFYVSALWTLLAAVLVLIFVQEPERGGKEKVLQDMIQQGTRYERKLSWKGFLHAMRHNKSNAILMWQGFFSSVPWGIIFVFLNDYLSQERGFSVPDATYLVLIFGIGCAAGGVLGGWWGQIFMRRNRSYLPLFMAVTTFLGIFPFLALLDGSFTNAHGFAANFFSFMGGLIASLPSVNVRPCIINVNPPETRGAALTAANLIINLARGAGPSCITLMGAIWGVNRKFSFNVTLAFFWIVSALQLCLLAKTLPHDQDAMEAELADYAEKRLQEMVDDEGSIVSIEERMTSFDAGAARESIQFMGEAIREISDEIRLVGDEIRHRQQSRPLPQVAEEKDIEIDISDFERRRKIWMERQRRSSGSKNDSAPPQETTPLL